MRLQLNWSRLSYALTAAFFMLSHRASADGNISARVSTEISAYQDSTATTVFTPTVLAALQNEAAGWGVNARYLVDVVSAASPDIVSTASRRWVEVRHAGNLGVQYKPGNTGIAVSGATSSTPDYLSFSGSGTFTQDFNEKNLTLILSYGLGYDQIGKTGTPFSVFSRDFVYHSASAGFSSVISPSAIFSLIGDVVIERGDQSKPYRFIPLFSKTNAAKVTAGESADLVADLRDPMKPLEQLPTERERYAITGRLAVRPGSATLRLDERLYTDTWSMRASTTDFRYMISASDRVMFWPHLRFHYQTPVSFWKLAYVIGSDGSIPTLRTGDRELGQLLNAGTGLGMRFSLGPAGKADAWVLTTTVDGVYTKFFDALYVTTRLSVLGVVNLEATF